MQLLVLAAAIINAQRPSAPDNKYWDDVVALPQVVNGVLMDSRQPVTATKSVTLGTGRFGGQCMQVAEGQLYSYAGTPFVLAGDFTFEGHAYFTGSGDNDYIFDTGGNQLVLKLVGAQWQVAYGGSSQPLIAPGFGPQLNRWYHFAVVRQGALLKLYIDGISVGQSTLTSTLASVNFSWGDYTFGSSYSHIGKLDQCRISSMARYTGNFTPLMEPWPIGGPEAGFDPFWGQNVLLTKDGGVDATGKGTFVTVGANATISTVQKRFGTDSMKVSGGSHFRMADNDNRFDFETTDFTIEGWFYPLASLGGTVHLIGRSGTGASGGYRLALDNMRPRIFYSNAANSWTATAPIASSEIGINRWTHIAMSRAGNVMKLFVNGKLLQVQVFSGTMNASTLGFTVGADSNSLEPFNGHIDSVRVTRACRYSESFTPKLVNDFAVRDNAGGEAQAGYDTYYNNTVLQLQLDNTLGSRRGGNAAISAAGASYTFDSSRLLFDKPTISWTTGLTALASYGYGYSLIASPEFTVECWTNSNYNNTTNPFSLASQWGTGGWGLTLHAGKARFYYTNTLFIESTSRFDQNNWKHLAVTRRNGVITMYVDGVAEASVNYAGAFTSSQALQLGRISTNGADSGFRVNMAELRITNGVSRYNTTFAKPTKAQSVSSLAA